MLYLVLVVHASYRPGFFALPCPPLADARVKRADFLLYPSTSPSSFLPSIRLLRHDSDENRTNERTNDFPSARRPSLCHLAYPRPSPYLALALPISLLDVAFAQQFSPQFKLLPPATDTKSSTKHARLIAMHSPVPLVLVVDVGTRAINGARREATERERERGRSLARVGEISGRSIN